MKTVSIEQATLDACLQYAQHEHVVITRNGIPVALIVGVEGMDADQVQLGGSERFWKLIANRRSQQTVDRAALEQVIEGQSSVE